MPTYFNYVTQEIEEIASVEAFYLIPAGLNLFKIIASPEPVTSMNCDRISKSDCYWPLTWAQIEPHVAQLFPNNQLRDAPLTSTEVETLFGFTQIQLEQDRQFFVVLITDGHNVLAMIDQLTNSTDVEAIRTTVSELRELANHEDNPENQQILAEAGVIPPLVRCLGFHDDTIQQLAAGALFNLIYEYPDNQAMLYEAQGIPALIHLLHCEAPATLQIAAETLHQLVKEEDTLHQDAVREAGGLTLVLNLLKKFRTLNEDTKYWLLKLLNESLVRNEANQNTVLAADGIEWLLPLLFQDSEDDQLRRLTLEALDHLALKDSQSQAVFCQAGGIGLLLSLLSQDNAFETKQAATNLLLILLQNPAHQAILRQAGGMLTLVSLLNSTDRPNKCLVLQLIVHSAHRNQLNQNAILKAGGIHLLLVASVDPTPRVRELARNALLAVVLNNPANLEAVRELAHSNEQPVQQAASRLLSTLHKRSIDQVVQHGLFHAQAPQTDTSDPNAQAEKKHSG